ncbi:hypothetical protein [Methanoregula sp.]|uniref:hypothetical protein n=1 Tax=Methanoregula sp. TaxID=2052170 RepID=UPI002C3CF833|nr:hypothetical protein [Methanoregula sp.]HVP96035.1 hypothetical protein [Methanoregula sp.]
MQIEIRRGISLQPGSFSAVVLPVKQMVGALNSSAEIRRFLFLYIGGNYSRVLPGLDRTSQNLEICRAFTAHQLLALVREAGHTVIFVEHDPGLFDGAEEMLDPVAGALADAGRESLVLLYTPVPDRPFFALARRAGRYIEVYADDEANPLSRTSRHYGLRPAGSGQRTLEVS